MSLEKLVIKARSMSDRDAAESLRQLANDERWPAVVKLIDEQRESYVMEASKQSNATHPGVQAHAMGSIFALQLLLEAFAAAVQPPKSKRKRAEQEVDS